MKRTLCTALHGADILFLRRINRHQNACADHKTDNHTFAEFAHINHLGVIIPQLLRNKRRKFFLTDDFYAKFFGFVKFAARFIAGNDNARFFGNR